MSKLFKFSNLVVVAVIIMNLWYTREVLESFRIVGSEPTVLTGAFFAFTTGELWMLKEIKKVKVTGEAKKLFNFKKNEDKQEDTQGLN